MTDQTDTNAPYKPPSAALSDPTGITQVVSRIDWDLNPDFCPGMSIILVCLGLSRPPRATIGARGLVDVSPWPCVVLCCVVLTNLGVVAPLPQKRLSDALLKRHINLCFRLPFAEG